MWHEQRTTFGALTAPQPRSKRTRRHSGALSLPFPRRQACSSTADGVAIEFKTNATRAEYHLSARPHHLRAHFSFNETPVYATPPTHRYLAQELKKCICKHPTQTKTPRLLRTPSPYAGGATHADESPTQCDNRLPDARAATSYGSGFSGGPSGESLYGVPCFCDPTPRLQ